MQIKFTKTVRKAIPADNNEWVQKSLLEGSAGWPLVIAPRYSAVNLNDWIKQNLRLIHDELTNCGAVLFRGFDLNGQSDFGNILDTLSSDQLMEYKYKSTPRTHVGKNIYTSTEYPADQEIPMHNEMSYASSWPTRIAFYSEMVADAGGATPLADSSLIYTKIPREIVAEFEAKKVMYVRNYGDLDLSWQDVFQTTDKAEVETFCKASGLEYKWLDGNRLKTWQICDAVMRHPQKNCSLWFNQAHLFHVSALHEKVKSQLLAMVPYDELPRNACFGDGTVISDEVIKTINAIYSEHSLVFPWQKNDLLLLDNLLIAHGRKPFEGKRKVLVGMY